MAHRSRALLVAFGVMWYAMTGLAQGTPCEICQPEPDSHHAHSWCHFPPDGDWGFDDCRMYTDAQGVEQCYYGGMSQCLYTEYHGGNGTDGGSLGDPRRDDSGACPAEYATCG